MSLQFGEIIEPTTRAFWDNYEDFVVNQESEIRLSLVWSRNCSENSIPEKFKTLLVIEGIGIHSLVNALVGKSQQLCKIRDSDMAVYRINDELIICASNERDLNKAGEATELLSPFVRNAENVIGIAILPSVTYNGTDVEGECFIRGINSSVSKIRPLEVPNFITGLVAGCATYRLHSKLDVSLYACFVSTPFFELVQIEPIINLMSSLNIPVNSTTFKQNQDNFGLYM